MNIYGVFRGKTKRLNQENIESGTIYCFALATLKRVGDQLVWQIPSHEHVRHYRSYDDKCYDEPFIRDMTEEECEYYFPANLPYRHGDLGESQ